MVVFQDDKTLGKSRRGKNKQPSVTWRRTPGGQTCELVHPPCAREREDDLQEVEQMLAAGEVDVAMDELRWLLEECPDLIAAHKLLGEIALSAGDLKLARAHLGYAYTIGDKALPQHGPPAPLSYQAPANQPFLEAAKGLAWSLHALGKQADAKKIAKRLLSLDPNDPLAVQDMLRQWEQDTHPPVDGDGCPK